MNLEKLINLNYLFERYPIDGFSLPIKSFLIIIFIISIIIAIISGKKLKNNPGIMKKVYNKLQNWGWTTGLIGFLLFFFREVNTIYLGSRIWMIILLISSFIWLLTIFKYYKKEVPKRKIEKKEKEEFNKYLPKKK